MNINEKLEELNIDKGQIIIFSVIGCIIIFILFGLLSFGSEEKEKYSDLEVPENKAVSNYETKLEAYAKENQIKQNKTSLNFDRGGVFGVDSTANEKTQRELLESKVDSMFNRNKRNNQNNTVTEEKEKSNTPKRKQKNSIKVEKDTIVVKKKLSIEDQILIARKKAMLKRKEKEDNIQSRSYIKSYKGTDNFIKQNISVKATVDFDQKVSNKQLVRMRLLEDLSLSNVVIPEDTSIWGTCSFSNNGRVKISVKGVSYNNQLYPVSLNSYDYRDGQEGLIVGIDNLREAIESETEKEILNETSSLGKVLQTASKIFKKRNVKVELYDNHPMYLKN